MKIPFLALGLLALGTPAIATSLSFAGPKPKLARPVVTCVAATQASFDLQVCGGSPTGAPAGFSIQWMTLADFQSHVDAGPDEMFGTFDDFVVTNSWFGSDDQRLCKASFSGNANDSRYNLAANQCITVRIGELLLDNGASTTCPDSLPCGTTYVVRAFAHATSTQMRSDFTANLPCSTTACDTGCDPAVKSQGFWKTHEAATEALVPGVITIGCQNYTAAQLDAILGQTPAGGNGLVSLAHQVIATRLNILNGASQAYIDATAVALAGAETLMCSTGAVPPVGGGTLAPAATSPFTFALDGQIGTFECQ